MISTNRTVNRAHSIIVARIEKLREKKQDLRSRIDEKYPYEIYGIKGDLQFEKYSKKYDDEISLLQKYDSGMYDLIEIVEGGK